MNDEPRPGIWPLLLSIGVMYILWLTVDRWWAWPAEQTPEVVAPAQRAERGYLRLPPLTGIEPGTVYRLTFYTCSEAEGTADCVTFSGEPAGPGMAANNELPIGAEVAIPDRGVFRVTDRGGGLGRNHLDLWTQDRDTAFREGVQYAKVYRVK